MEACDGDEQEVAECRPDFEPDCEALGLRAVQACNEGDDTSGGATSSSASSGTGGDTDCDTHSYQYCEDDDLPCYPGTGCTGINSSGTRRCTVTCESDADCDVGGLSGDCSCASSEFGCHCLFTTCE